MIDKDLLIYSLIGYRQFLAYQEYNSNISINTSIKRVINIQFGIRFISYICSTIISTLIGSIKFYIVRADKSYLLRLANQDYSNIYYNNITNSLIMTNCTISVIHHFGHL